MKRKKMVQKSVVSNFVDLPFGAPDNYVPIDKRVLDIGDLIGFSLFYNRGFGQLSLFLQSGSIIEKEDKEKLLQTDQIFIHKSHSDSYESFIETKIQKTAEDDSIPLDNKADLIYTSSAQITKHLYENPAAQGNIEHSKKVVEPILHTIFNNKGTVKSFMKIIGYDYYTHTHSLNVCIYSLCLGSELNLNKKILKNLGSSALLHDLGKSSIDYSIINKCGKLTQLEFDEIKKHPHLGHEIALKLGIKDNDILDGIRHHHEKLDGTGYPDGLSKEGLTIFPRIIGICDIFDALTTKRSYKMALHSYDALLLMKTHMHKQLDMKFIDSFIKILHG